MTADKRWKEKIKKIFAHENDKCSYLPVNQLTKITLGIYIDTEI